MCKHRAGNRPGRYARPAMTTSADPLEAPGPALPLAQPDPDQLMRTCASCGGQMEERKCRLICTGCGYFLSCSDYY